MNRYLRDHILKPLYYHIRKKPFVYKGFYINQLSDLYFATGAKGHEPETQQWIKDNYKSNDVYYDIGAGVGLFSLQASKQGCNVFAFEREPKTFNTLLNNCRLNNSKINCHCVSVDSSFTIDDMTRLFPFPNHIKIDTEGMEPLILLGMTKTLSNPLLRTLVIESFSHEGFDDYLKRFNFEFVGVSKGDEKNRYYIRVYHQICK